MITKSTNPRCFPVSSTNSPSKSSTAGTQASEKIKEFGAAVKAERARLGLSQEVLAERADLHRTYITDIERGARNCSLETICKLAVALEVSVESLFAPRGSIVIRQ